MRKKDERVAVVGIGYVGLPVACIFAEQGFETVGIDVLPDRVDKINSGDCPIGGEEPGLAELLSAVVRDCMLTASTSVSAVSDADLIVVCVDTPIGSDRRPVLDSLRAAVEGIGQHMKRGAMVSIESTIPPGTMTGMVIPTIERASGYIAGEGFHVVHCPERVMPGRLLANLREYKRVLGGLDETSSEKALEYYSTFVEEDILVTSLINAEICKTGENAYRDVQIAFANEMALICEALGADVYEVRELINSCPFRDMHIPGSGVGGYCLPKDSWLLLGNVRSGFSKLIADARRVNESMPAHLAELAVQAIRENCADSEGGKVAVLGLSFIKDSDDTRNSPAIEVIDRMAPVFDVLVHDPYVKEFKEFRLSSDIREVLRDAICAIFVTDHSCYQNIALEEMMDLMSAPIVIDGRNIFDSGTMDGEGFVYSGIGKGRR